MGDTDETTANKVTEVVDVDKEKVDDQSKDKDAETEEERKKRKLIAPRSDVWEHFSKVKLSGGEEKAKCKYCGKLLCCDTKTNELGGLNISKETSTEP